MSTKTTCKSEQCFCKANTKKDEGGVEGSLKVFEVFDGYILTENNLKLIEHLLLFWAKDKKLKKR